MILSVKRVTLHPGKWELALSPTGRRYAPRFYLYVEESALKQTIGDYLHAIQRMMDEYTNGTIHRLFIVTDESDAGTIWRAADYFYGRDVRTLRKKRGASPYRYAGSMLIRNR